MQRGSGQTADASTKTHVLQVFELQVAKKRYALTPPELQLGAEVYAWTPSLPPGDSADATLDAEDSFHTAPSSEVGEGEGLPDTVPLWVDEGPEGSPEPSPEEPPPSSEPSHGPVRRSLLGYLAAAAAAIGIGTQDADLPAENSADMTASEEGLRSLSGSDSDGGAGLLDDREPEPQEDFVTVTMRSSLHIAVRGAGGKGGALNAAGANGGCMLAQVRPDLCHNAMAVRLDVQAEDMRKPRPMTEVWPHWIRPDIACPSGPSPGPGR